MFKQIKNFFINLKNKFFGTISDEIGIDLGTTNTLVYVKGRGIVINEPSIVAVNSKTGQIVAVGQVAKNMLGRTPGHIKAVQPVIDGVISDFEITEEMLAYLLDKASGKRMKFFGPRVVVGVPSGITNVEVRAVEDAAKNAGAREVYIVEEPMAAAVGIKLPVKTPTGSMVVDIGGGTTDIGIVSLGGLVNARNITVAGDTFNNDIINYIRSEFKILIGKKTAEEIKIKVNSVKELDEPLETIVRGRDLVSGLPREVVITDTDVRDAISTSVLRLVEVIKEVLETTPPEVVADVMRKGVYLTGGGALLRGLDDLLKEELGVPVRVADDPLTAVVRGTSEILTDIPGYKEALITHDYEFTPKE